MLGDGAGELGWDEFSLHQDSFENAKESILLTSHGLLGVEGALQGHARQTVREAQ